MHRTALWFLATCCGLFPLVAAAEPCVLLEAGRDYPETRFFSACVLRGQPASAPLLAVAGFTQTGQGDVADLALYEITPAAARLHSRIMRRGSGNSSIRTLRANDLDGDGLDELVALGRAGDEEADSTGELQVYSVHDGLPRLAASASWQSGRYTHGYGMDVADLDGDGRAEIVSGGFFRGENNERAELRVWRLDGSKLVLLASQTWGSSTGDTRINAVAVGDITGDGRPDIVAGGRTGQVTGSNDTSAAEADQITVWSFETDRLCPVAQHDGDPGRRSRFRELRLANIDDQPGLEILAAGRTLARGPRGGSAGGRGRGTGGRGGGGGGAAQPAIRPTLLAFALRDDRLVTVGEAAWGNSLGEVRDLAVLDQADGTRVITILADELKPQRQAQMAIWKWNGPGLTADQNVTAAFGTETRARQIVVWPGTPAPVLLTVGFVKHDEQLLGQIIRWVELP